MLQQKGMQVGATWYKENIIRRKTLVEQETKDPSRRKESTKVTY